MASLKEKEVEVRVYAELPIAFNAWLPSIAEHKLAKNKKKVIFALRDLAKMLEDNSDPECLGADAYLDRKGKLIQAYIGFTKAHFAIQIVDDEEEKELPPC